MRAEWECCCASAAFPSFLRKRKSIPEKIFSAKWQFLRFLMYNRGCLDLCMNNPSGVLLYITPPGKARQNQHYCMSLDNPRRGRRSMRNEERG